MAVRLAFWGTGIAAGLLLAWALSSSGSALFKVLGFLGTTAAFGLVGEGIATALLGRSEDEILADSPPADGTVEITSIAGARGVRNPIDERFSRFEGLDPGANGVAPHAPGEVRPLLGRVALVSVFVGKDGTAWSDQEIVEAHEALMRGGRWLEREAVRWEAPVNVAIAETYFVAVDDATQDVEVGFVHEPGGGGVAPFEAKAVTKAIIEMSRAAARVGFHDALDLVGRVNPRIGADVIVWLLHLRRAGRSLAIPMDRTELAGVSLAVCYAKEANLPEPLEGTPFTDPVTILHEMLHLFGATDKYGVPLKDFPNLSVTSHDVMRLSESVLSRLRIDPRTAWEIGWGPEPPVGSLILEPTS